MKRIFSIVFALALVLGLGVVMVPMAHVMASPGPGDVTIIVQDQAGNNIQGASASLLFYGGGKGGYSMPSKTTDSNGSATYSASEIQTWLSGTGYVNTAQIYVQPGATYETGTAMGKVRTVSATDGFPSVLYNNLGSWNGKAAMTFTYKLIMYKKQPLQVEWNDAAQTFTTTYTLDQALANPPTLKRMWVERYPYRAGDPGAFWVYGVPVAGIYNKWGSIAAVPGGLGGSLATVTGTSVSATFNYSILANNQDSDLMGVYLGIDYIPAPSFTGYATKDVCRDDYNFLALSAANPWSYFGRGLSGSTATGTGTASFGPNSGTLTGFSAVAEGSLPTAGKPNLAFPHGFFSFTITGLSTGATVTVTITLPPGAAPTQYWKYHPNTQGGWVQIPMVVVGPPNVIRITLIDGGLGDDDGAADGTIVDQGGPGTGPVGWETYPINKVRVLLPWIASLVAIMAGASLLVLRRRRAQS